MKISKFSHSILCAFLLLFTLSTRPALAQSQDVPREQLLLLLSGEWVSRALYAATRLEIADHLQTSPKSVEDLATATESDPESLYRVLHMLAGFNIFEEVSPGSLPIRKPAPFSQNPIPTPFMPSPFSTEKRSTRPWATSFPPFSQIPPLLSSPTSNLSFPTLKKTPPGQLFFRHR